MPQIKAQEAGFFQMNLGQAREKLQKTGQEQLLAFWDSLDPMARDSLLAQIEMLDLPVLAIQQQLVKTPNVKAIPGISPLQTWDVVGAKTDQVKGAKRIAEGKVGCIVVAGGQGTRLGFPGPKGLFPITLIKQKSLFQLLAEKVKAASIQAGRPLPLAIMTSPQNDTITRRYFEENDYFGLQAQQLQFFVQGVLPLISESGQLLLQAEGVIAVGPDGNGWTLHHFHQSNIWEKWQSQGVEEVIFIQIDNCLADPFDAELVGYHLRKEADISLKATYRRSIDERVGLVVELNDRIGVVEYTEMPEDEKIATNSDGSLQYQVANLSMFCFSMSFIEKLNDQPLEAFPLHLAHKPAKILDSSGCLQEVYVWKCERFIFDVLPFAEKVAVLVYPREQCYAALKNGVGADSLAEAQEALLNLDRRTFTSVSGLEVPTDRNFELSPQFHYPTPDLLHRWKGVHLPSDDYIQE